MHEYIQEHWRGFVSGLHIPHGTWTLLCIPPHQSTCVFTTPTLLVLRGWYKGDGFPGLRSQILKLLMCIMNTYKCLSIYVYIYQPEWFFICQTIFDHSTQVWQTSYLGMEVVGCTRIHALGNSSKHSSSFRQPNLKPPMKFGLRPWNVCPKLTTMSGVMHLHIDLR